MRTFSWVETSDPKLHQNRRLVNEENRHFAGPRPSRPQQCPNRKTQASYKFSVFSPGIPFAIYEFRADWLNRNHNVNIVNIVYQIGSEKSGPQVASCSLSGSVGGARPPGGPWIYYVKELTTRPESAMTGRPSQGILYRITTRPGSRGSGAMTRSQAPMTPGWRSIRPLCTVCNCRHTLAFGVSQLTSLPI
jgi:hypothetical protein